MAKKVFKQPRMRVPRRIRKDELMEVRVKVQHNSYTGLDIVDGEYVNARDPYYLKVMEVYYGDELTCKYDMTAATSPNPLIRFKLRAVKEGPLRVVFENSEGERKETQAEVKFA